MDPVPGIEREISKIDREILKLSSKREMLVWELGLRKDERPDDSHKPLTAFAEVMN
ncbi:MAG: hypothetical protein O8C61_05515 [Candidatus Methanoperedens sp.]|nr:hypothetical protein [Candidatus Methanoperedens sp.]